MIENYIGIYKFDTLLGEVIISIDIESKIKLECYHFKNNLKLPFHKIENIFIAKGEYIVKTLFDYNDIFVVALKDSMWVHIELIDSQHGCPEYKLEKFKGIICLP